MKWIEVISLRSASHNSEEICKEVLASIKECKRDQRLKEMKLYRHGTIEIDISVQLAWESGNVNLMGSEAAQHLIHLLKEYGLVNHSVWIESDSL